MLLALVLLTFTLTAFSAVSRSARQAQQLAQLQQSGQLALNILQNELQNMAFWGGLNSNTLDSAMVEPAAPAPDCYADDLDSGSFPQADTAFVTVYAQEVSAGSQLNCIPSASEGSELLQLKRLIGQVTSPGNMRSNRFYVETDWQHSRFVSNDSPLLDDRFRYYPYQHIVFYVQRQQSGDQTIPVLMRKRLVRSQAGSARIGTDSVLDGVERLHFQFGIDSNLDGQVNYFLNTEDMTDAHWQQINSRILSVKFYILLRSLEPDGSFRDTRQYQMGKQLFVAPGDHYRRLLISSSVFFHNAVL